MTTIILFKIKSFMHRSKITYVWSAVSAIKDLVWKVQILKHVHLRRFQIVSVDTRVPDTVLRLSAVRCFCLLDLGRFQTDPLRLYRLFGKQLCYDYENEKQASLIQISMWHSFPGRLLRCHIRKFHQINVSFWCALPCDLVKTFYSNSTSHTLVE